MRSRAGDGTALPVLMLAVGRATDTTKQTVRERGADLAYALGGWSGKKDGAGRCVDGVKGKWKPNTAVFKEIC